MYIAIVVLIALFGVYAVFSPGIKKANSRIRKAKSQKNFEKLEDEFELSSDASINQFDTLYAEMERYNIEIYENEQEGLSGEIPSNETVFEVENGMHTNVFAFVKIIKRKKKKSRNGNSKIKEKIITFPVYLKANRQNYKNGFVPMPYTSMPIGGEDTFSVLCGYAKEKLFDKKKCIVSVGDRLILQNPFEEIVYEVYEIGGVNEEDIDILRIADGATELALLMFLPRNKKRVGIFAMAKEESRIYGDADDIDGFKDLEDDE